MTPTIPPTAASIPEWIRRCTQAVNALIRSDDQNSRRLTTVEAFQAALSNLHDYPDDPSAATGGIAVGGFYRNGSVVMVRTV